MSNVSIFSQDYSSISFISYLVEWLAVGHYPANIAKQLENGSANHGDRKCDKLPRPYRLHQEENQRKGEEGSEKAVRR